MPSLAGTTFVTLDKAVAGRAQELLARQRLTKYDVQEWLTDYNQLKRFAEANAGDSYVARGWREEEPRYANVVKSMQAKITGETWTPTLALTQSRPQYTPRLYDFGMNLNRSNGNGCGCGGGGSNVPLNNYGGSTVQPVPSRVTPQLNILSTGNAFPSIGDMLRDLFGVKPTPAVAPVIDASYPDSQLIDQKEIVTGIITAVIVGGVLYVVHRATQK